MRPHRPAERSHNFWNAMERATPSPPNLDEVEAGSSSTQMYGSFLAARGADVWWVAGCGRLSCMEDVRLTSFSHGAG